jgi:hypothetical protein
MMVKVFFIIPFPTRRTTKGAFKMKKLSFMELMKRNKEELLKDKIQLKKIEKRIDQKYIKQSK